MKDQLELFALNDTEVDAIRCIDEALHHVENQSVLRRLLAGESWSDAFGIGGCGGPGMVGWSGDSKGIKLDTGELIPPSRILERARQYGS